MQVNLLKNMFHKAMGELANKLDINTIDGFQVASLTFPCLLAAATQALVALP